MHKRCGSPFYGEGPAGINPKNALSLRSAAQRILSSSCARRLGFAKYRRPERGFLGLSLPAPSAKKDCHTGCATVISRMVKE